MLQRLVTVDNAHRLLVAAVSFLSLGAHPNILLVNLDDVRADGIDRMQVVQERLSRESLRFVDSFVTTPVCWASRTSTLTGRYASHHRVQEAHSNPAASFRLSGGDCETIAVWLRREGYTTGLFGKYINGYTDERTGLVYYVPPGWDRWRAFGTRPHYGGQFGAPYTIIKQNQYARAQETSPRCW